MGRAPAASDVFAAVAEPRRREIIALLADDRRRSVTELAAALRLAQPAVSKHLGVLREVGLVTVHRVGKNRFYALNAGKLKPMHDWVSQFERMWSHQLDRIKARAENLAADRARRN